MLYNVIVKVSFTYQESHLSFEIKAYRCQSSLDSGCGKSKSVELDKVHMDDNGANVMTKPLTKEKLDVC